MGIRAEKVNNKVVYRVHCDYCDPKRGVKRSQSTHEDPGDLAIKAKKEKFVTVAGTEVFDPMTWACSNCTESIIAKKKAS